MGIEDFLPELVNSETPSNVLRGEYDFVIKKILLTAYNGAQYDITNHRLTFCYYEDLFVNCTSGHLDLLDAIDYPQFMPLIGEEKLQVILTRPDEHGSGREYSLLPDLEMNFRVYKVSGRQIQNEKVQTYRIHLISEEFIKDLKNKVYQTFSSVPYSKMVEDVYTKYLKVSAPITLEITKYDQNFAISNLSPLEFINMVASRSISDSGNGETYTFYQDRDGFHFTSLGKLFQGEVKQKYGHAPRQILDTQANKFLYADQPIEFEMINAEHYHWNGQHDILRNIESGMYGQSVTTIDVVRQKFETIDFDLQKEFDTFKHIDKEKFFTDGLDALGSPKAHTKLISTNKDHDIVEWIADKEPGIKPSKLEEYVLKRTSQLHQINNFRLGFTVSGDPRRKVGDIIEFALPQVASDVHAENPQQLDRYFQGKYLVTSIRHTLTQNKYSMEIEVIKDTFFKPIEHTDVVDKYKDIW